MISLFKKSEKAADPVCLMKVDKKTAKFQQTFEEKTYYFCSGHCVESFKKEPKSYID